MEKPANKPKPEAAIQEAKSEVYKGLANGGVRQLERALKAMAEYDRTGKLPDWVTREK
jgi:hypothetical protein